MSDADTSGTQSNDNTENTGNTESTADTGSAAPPDAGGPEAGATGAPPETATAAEKPARKAPARKTAKKTAKIPGKSAEKAADKTTEKPAKKTTARKATKKAASRKTAESAPEPAAEAPAPDRAGDQGVAEPAEAAPAKKTARKSTRKTAAKAASKSTESTEPAEAAPSAEPTVAAPETAGDTPGTGAGAEDTQTGGAAAPMVLFQPPEKAPRKSTRKAPARKKAASKSDDATEQPEQAAGAAEDKAGEQKAGEEAESADRTKTAESGGEEQDQRDENGGSDEGGGRRRRRRGGRRRRKSGGDDAGDESEKSDQAKKGEDSAAEGDESGGEGGSRRRRTRNRQPKNPEDEIASVSGSTRLEAKKQRRREGREAGRRRAPIVSEAEFLARRESVDRVMVIRQREDLTQIAVMEDKVLVEHYVARESQTSLIGNVYLGRVQNVLPSMEAAFIDIGKGRNAVLYAGEVNWRGLGHKDGQPRKIESVLSSGQTVLVQVTKDPIGHKGARLTGQISLPGRFLVYVPDGNTSGISRKLPDTERSRLKSLLKQIVPESAGVIVRTAAEGASEDELTRDVERLTARWGDIEKKVEAGKGPELLYGEPDLTLKVVRDLFTEDFSRLVVQGDDAWDLVDGYVSHVAPDLRDRLERYQPEDGQGDVFASQRIDEQIAKGLDRKVWLPSGGSLIIDRTEAMTVVDVNTGKFTGSGGNLEETVTKNNLEAAEEIVRQLRLRDLGGIIVIDFIDMVLESNRDLVLRRLVECLGRDRTRHQVAEVTSLGLVQMTRKRIGTGLVEAFSTECEHCKGRGVVLHDHPVEHGGGPGGADDEGRGRRHRGGRGRNKSGNGDQSGSGQTPPKPSAKPSPKDIAAMRPHPPEPQDEQDAQDAQDRDGAAEVPEEPAETREAPEVEPSPAEETQPVVLEDAEDVQPVVVTSTRRRRTASRPAGPPQGTPDEVPEQPFEPATGSTADGTAPVAAGDDADAPADDEQTADTESADEPSLQHVPVKKKGRKR